MSTKSPRPFQFANDLRELQTTQMAMRPKSKREIAFYEKVIKVKADVAALLTFLVLCGFRHISGENFALG